MDTSPRSLLGRIHREIETLSMIVDRDLDLARVARIGAIQIRQLPASVNAFNRPLTRRFCQDAIQRKQNPYS